MSALLEEVAEPAAPSRVVVPASLGAWLEPLLVFGLTFLLLPLSWVLRATLDDPEYLVGFVMFHAAFVINDPHFCVTYLLFYDDARRQALSPDVPRAQRRRWLFAGVVLPAVLVAWAVGAIATASPQALGWMIQLMLLAVGFHYVKQGFGVLMVLSARRGVRFSRGERNVVLAHAYTAWAFAWANPATPAGDFVEKGVVYWAPARPEVVELVAGVLLAVSTVVLIAVLAQKWRKEGGLPLVPLAGFLVTVWLWTIFTSLDPLLRYAIPALHSLQYLYFVWLMRRGRAHEAAASDPFGPSVRSRLLWLAGSALALGFLLLRAGPEFLDGFVDPRSPLGPTPFFAAFYVVINLHHFAMDYVIWRKESPLSRYLQAR